MSHDAYRPLRGVHGCHRVEDFRVLGRILRYTSTCLTAAARLSLKEKRLTMWDFPKIGVPYFGVLITRILLFRVLYIRVPYFRKPPFGTSGSKIERAA